MSNTPEEAAALAKDAYKKDADRLVNTLKPYVIDGHPYKVIAAVSDPTTGYRARAYQRTDTGAVTIAECGTMSPLKDGGLDAATDFLMVRNQTNRQWPEAEKFAGRVVETIKQDAAKRGVSVPDITVTGHSLGGTLTELTSAKFDLPGVTFNAYGAVDLGYGVPEGGSRVTNYVMAGDVVSAASRHYGKVVTLASDDDVQALKAGRYLDTAPGMPPPNPYLTMSLADHRVTHFSPDAGSHEVSVLNPAMLARYEKNYADHKAAIDHFRHDVYKDRAELGVALRRTNSHDLASTWNNLPPRLQQQLAEWHAHEVDAPIHSAVTHNGVALGIEHGLGQAGDAMRAAGQSAHVIDERVAASVRRTGFDVAPIMPTAPLAGMALAEGVHLHGELAQAVGHFADEQAKHARQAVQFGTHVAAVATTTIVHTAESNIVDGADLAQGAYRGGKAAFDRTVQAYESASQAVSQGVDAIGRAAQRAGDSIHGFAEHTGAAYAESMTLRGQALAATTDALTHRISGETHVSAAAPNRSDPRQAGSPLHELYNELHRRIPDAGERRLLQFTAACHAHHINERNLGAIHLDEATATMHFNGNDIWARPVGVNFSQPSPPPEQSIQHIRQHDQQQAQWMGRMHAQQQAQPAQSLGTAQAGPAR